MKRYCIVCERQFGCVIEGEKHNCSDCRLKDRCLSKKDHSKSTITGGICESCWGDRQYIKAALKIQDIALRLNLKPSQKGIKNLSREIRFVFSPKILLTHAY